MASRSQSIDANISNDGNPVRGSAEVPRRAATPGEWLAGNPAAAQRHSKAIDHNQRADEKCFGPVYPPASIVEGTGIMFRTARARPVDGPLLAKPTWRLGPDLSKHGPSG